MKQPLTRLLRECVVCTFLTVAFGAAGQTVFNEDFLTPVNYLTNGVEGTLWDGVYLGAGSIAFPTGTGVAPGSVSVANGNVSSPNVLTVSSLQTDWEGAAADGFFLFKVVAGDFDMSVHVVPPIDTGAYNFPGLMVRAFGPGGSAAPGGKENSLLFARFDQFTIANMLKNNVNGSKTDTGLGTYPNTNYWLRIQRSGDAFTLSEKAVETEPWSVVGAVSRADFSGLPLQVGIEHATFGGGATRIARYEKFRLSTAAFSPAALPSNPTALMVTTNPDGTATLDWTPGTGSDGSLAILWDGASTLTQAPASGSAYTASPVFGMGDTLPATNCYVVYCGSGQTVTVTNLTAGKTYYAAVFSYAGNGTSRVYNHISAHTSVMARQPAFLVSATLVGPDVYVSANATPGKLYWLQWTAELNAATWQYLARPVTAPGAKVLCIDTNGAQLGRRFYRLVELDTPPTSRNLSYVASPVTSAVSAWETLLAINDGFEPNSSADHTHGIYGNWPLTGTQWVEYDWPENIETGKIDVYWFSDGGGIQAPAACRLKYWDPNTAGFITVQNAVGLGVALDRWNTTVFNPVMTTKLRLEIDSGAASTGIIEWRVYDAGGSPPNFAPLITPGVDRTAIAGGNTWLGGTVRDDGRVYSSPVTTWTHVAGPGPVSIANPNAIETTAVASTPGTLKLQLTANDGQFSASNSLSLKVVPPPPTNHARTVYPAPYTITSSLWRYRMNRTLTNWIPYLYTQLNNPAQSVGNINGFIQAGNKLNGRAYTVPAVDPWADAFTLNVVESMSYALMYDAQGDPAILAAQTAFRTNLNYWIPLILGAQEPDGYLHTYTTLRGAPRWTDNSWHEGYVAGYFIDAALAHYMAMGQTNNSLYLAAKKIADCWCNNIGPGKRAWFDGHEALELSLVRLARFMNEFEAPGSGQKYLDLAKFLIDSRHDGAEYDQSHLPVTRQYQAVGHAVRAVYLYTGMQDIAMETGDIDYQSAVASLFDNFVNRKYYVQGGAGSGESSEGFGIDYSLPNSSYCETCAGCGTLFFFHRLNLGHQHAKYADLMENVLYNEILGSLNDAATRIYYPNALNTSAARDAWTGVPCCYGNAPRTLFQMPSWVYARGSNSIYVNLYIGSSITISNISGTTVRVVQATEYPWTNSISLVVQPSIPAAFTLWLRIPSRALSALYTTTPDISGITSLTLNGAPATPVLTNGYAAITRTWTSGDKIDVEFPMGIQRIKCTDTVTANLNRVALQYGPIIYNIESVDQSMNLALNPTAPLAMKYTNILGGFLKITGNWSSGGTLNAIPNYARMNRGGSTAVWFRDQ